MTNKNEIWLDIPGYEGLYQASNSGNIRSLNYLGIEGRIQQLKPAITSTGYYFVQLSNKGHKKLYRIHRLVSCAFYSKPLDYEMCVNHKDGNKKNNNIDNLEFITLSENVKHAYSIGLIKPKNKKPKSTKKKRDKLTEQQIIEIKQLLNGGQYQQNQIAKMYGVSTSLVSRIKSGERRNNL